MDAGVHTAADVQRVLGVEQPAFVMDVLYRQLEFGLLETTGGTLQLTSLGREALTLGRAPTRCRETLKLLVDPAGNVMDATRVRHSGRRQGDLRHGAPPEVTVARVQDFVNGQREWREKNAVVTDLSGERLEQQMVTHGGQARLDLDARAWRNVLLDRGGQPSAELEPLVARVDWPALLDLGSAPAGQPALWSMYSEGALLEEDARRRARDLVEGAGRRLHLVGWDLTGQGTHAYARALGRVPGLRVTAELAQVTDDWEKLKAQFGARVTVKAVPGQVARLVADDLELQATPAWVPMKEGGTTGQTVTVARVAPAAVSTPA